MIDGSSPEQNRYNPTQKELPQPTPSAFDKYIDTRLAGKKWHMSSALTRNDATEASLEGYRDRMKRTGREISEIFGVDPDIFSDKKTAEVFLAICDSWAVNADKRDEPDYVPEQQFLTESVRLLAGINSLFNRDEYESKKPEAEYYFNTPDSNDTEAHIARLDGIRKNKDDALTEKLSGEFNNYGTDGVLALTRKNLGIRNAIDEKPYEVVVTKTASDETPVDGFTWRKHLAWPEGVTLPFAFVDRYPNGDTLLVMPSDHANNIFKGEEISLGLLGHEYSHTQRTVAIGFNHALGVFWEEVFANQASGSASHISSHLLLRHLDKMLGNDKALYGEMNQALQRDEVGNFFQFFAENFGLRSLLLTMATPPSAYTEYFGLETPNISSQPKERMGNLLDIVLKEAEQTNPDTRSNYLAFLSRAADDSSRIPADTSMEYWKLNGFKLPKDLQEIFDASFFHPHMH